MQKREFGGGVSGIVDGVLRITDKKSARRWLAFWR